MFGLVRVKLCEMSSPGSELFVNAGVSIQRLRRAANRSILRRCNGTEIGQLLSTDLLNGTVAHRLSSFIQREAEARITT